MTDNEYLQSVLEQQTLAEGSQELEDLREHRGDVEALLRREFSASSPTIRYGGSKAKGTMIRAAYDLDIICYFPHQEDDAGDSLEDIFCSVHTALSSSYKVQEKTVALRLKDARPESLNVDFHIDVVPGRFVDDSKEDAFLYCADGEKKRLKTNLDIHISHVRDSGVVDAIRLLKLWRVRNGLAIRHFALELLTVDILKAKSTSPLTTQLEHMWSCFRDESDSLSIEDPANPTGNDLSGLLSGSVRRELASVAGLTLSAIEDGGWDPVFGSLDEGELEDTERAAALQAAASRITNPAKPWYP